MLERLTGAGNCCGKGKDVSCARGVRSNISENSRKILESKARRGNKSVSEIREFEGGKNNESFIEFHLLSDFSKTFKINSSRKLANETEINVVEYEKLLEILKQSRNN